MLGAVSTVLSFFVGITALHRGWKRPRLLSLDLVMGISGLTRDTAEEKLEIFCLQI